MSRPSKPMARNFNSKHTTRNNKQEIFSKMASAAKTRDDKKSQSTGIQKENSSTDIQKENSEQPN